MTTANLTLTEDTPTWTQYTIASPRFGKFYCYRHTPADGRPEHPADRPWHLITTGRYFATPEEAAEYLDAVDWSESTESIDSSENRNGRIIDCGWHGYASEEGHYDLPDYA